MAEHFPCGILHGKGASAPDVDGCVLPAHHEGPHEYIAPDGEAWQWETNLECECEWCMRCEGDYCTVYWRKADSRGEVEYQSWLAALHTPAGVAPTGDGHCPRLTEQREAAAQRVAEFVKQHTPAGVKEGD